MSKIEEKSIRVIEFSGKEDDWKYWSVKILARADLRGFGELLIGEEKLPTKSEYTSAASIDPATPESKETIRLYNLGKKAFDELVLSCNTTTPAGRTAFSLISECRTPDNPKGDATSAWEKLKHKYEPSTAPSYIKLNRKFVNSKLTGDMNPDNWITELEGMRHDMNNVIINGKSMMTEIDLIIHIVSSVPDDYDIPVSILEDLLMSSSGKQLYLQTI